MPASTLESPCIDIVKHIHIKALSDQLGLDMWLERFLLFFKWDCKVSSYKTLFIAAKPLCVPALCKQKASSENLFCNIHNKAQLICLALFGVQCQLLLPHVFGFVLVTMARRSNVLKMSQFWISKWQCQQVHWRAHALTLWSTYILKPCLINWGWTCG